MRLTLRVALRFMRSRSLAWSTLPVAAVGAVVVALFISLEAFALSGAQVVERDLGGFDYASNLGNAVTVPPGNESVVQEIAAAAEGAGAENPIVTLTSVDVEPALTDPPRTLYLEGEWSSEPFSGRYVLVGGRWPMHADEVAVTQTSGEPLAQPGESLPVLAGTERFHVVGIVEDRYGDGPEILAAPGTWAGIGKVAVRSLPDLSASPTLYWNGGRRNRVADAVGAAVAKSSDRQEPDAGAAIRAATLSRVVLIDQDEQSWTDRIPAGYAIPSLLLPVMGVLGVFGLNRRRLRQSLDLLVDTGMGRTVAACSIGVALTGWISLALVVGAGAGVGIGIIGRLGLRPTVGQPLSPLPGLADPLWRLAVATLATCLIATMLLRYSLPPRQATGRRQRSAASKRHRFITNLRHTVATLAACATIWQLPRLESPIDAMILAATLAVTVLLMTPDLVDRLLGHLPGTDPRLRLARQQLIHDKARASIAVVVLAAVLGLPLGFLALLETFIATAGAGLISDVAPHQVSLNAPGGLFQPPLSRVVEAVESDSPLSTPTLQLRYLFTQHGFVMIQGPDIGAVLAIDTPEEVGSLTNRSLSSAETAMLNGGGMLVWDGQDGNERALVNESKVGPTQATVPAAATDFEPAWQQSTKGVMLTSTARDLGFPIADGAVVFTDVSDGDAKAAQQAVLKAGENPEQVVTYESPEPPYVPTAMYATAAGLMLVVLLTSLAVARTQVATLRGYLGTLVAIGLPTSWARHVILIQNALIVAMSTAVAVVIAILPTVLSAALLPGYLLSIPVGWLSLVIAAFDLAVFTATALSSRKLRAVDRLAV